jgi:hypothetical protein
VEYGPNIKEVVAQFAGIRETGIADPEYVLRYFNDSSKKAGKYEAYMADGSWKDRIGAYGGYILGVVREITVKKNKARSKQNSRILYREVRG